jgi:6-pyruvoyltetrahydropterin/6-carboxytetrahydropterin synthase
MKHESTKTYGHEQGLSCAFRQWRADSHCNLLHGYALAFRFTFGAEMLDAKGWVVDFGGLKVLKAKLVEHFDHTVAIAGDDPELMTCYGLREKGMMNVVMFPDGVGCEKFAKAAFHMARDVVYRMNEIEGGNRLHVLSAECMEHAGNSAIYRGDN